VGDVREVADRRCDQVKGARHCLTTKHRHAGKGKGPGVAGAFERKSKRVGYR
jgi:hypothetical protein